MYYIWDKMDIVTKNEDVIKFIRDRVSDRSGRPESTTPFSDRIIYESLRSNRASVLNQRMYGRRPVNHENYQSIGCIPLEEVDVSECPCAPRSGCTFKATMWDIPTPVGKFFSVSSINGYINYTFVEWDKFKYKINGRRASTSNTAYFTTKNTKKGVKLYLYNDIHKEFVSVTSVFSDPIKIYSYPNCDGTKVKCANYLKLPFPIDPDLLTVVYEMSIQTLRDIAPSSDQLNNESDDTRSQTPLK